MDLLNVPTARNEKSRSATTAEPDVSWPKYEGKADEVLYVDGSGRTRFSTREHNLA